MSVKVHCVMWVSPRTYSQLVDKSAFFYKEEETDKEYVIQLKQEKHAKDGCGYLVINGTYIGAFKLDDYSPSSSKEGIH